MQMSQYSSWMTHVSSSSPFAGSMQMGSLSFLEAVINCRLFSPSNGEIYVNLFTFALTLTVKLFRWCQLLREQTDRQREISAAAAKLHNRPMVTIYNYELAMPTTTSTTTWARQTRRVCLGLYLTPFGDKLKGAAQLKHLRSERELNSWLSDCDTQTVVMLSFPSFPNRDGGKERGRESWSSEAVNH